MTSDELNEEREFCVQLLAQRTKKEQEAAILFLIEKATNVEQLRAIETALIEAVLVSNPHLYRQLDNGKWVLQKKIGPVSAVTD